MKQLASVKKAGLVLGLSGLLSACSFDEQTHYQAESTRQMAERLAHEYDNLNPRNNAFANRKRIEMIRNQQEPVEPAHRFQYLANLGQELLYAGDTEEAIEYFLESQELLEDNPGQFHPGMNRMLQSYLALAYLRLGEQENCLINHTSASCIIPIRGDGIHQKEYGSENAINHYQKVLEHDPDDLNSRWLMNIAYMTLGQYPDEVPEPHLIPPGALESDYDLPMFIDIGSELGIDVDGLSGGSVVDDFTGNGYLDIVTSSWHLQDQIRFFENNGDGTFTDRTYEAGLKGITGGLNMVHADYTNNGLPDIYVLRGAWMGRDGLHPNSLLRNNGDGTFDDVTFRAGVAGEYPTQTAAWADVNHNGYVDLLVGYENTGGVHQPAQLFMNNGDGTFTDEAAQVGLNVTGFVKGVVWGDINNNGRPDLYISRLGQPNLMFRHEGTDENGLPRFTDITETAGVAEPIASFPTWFFDYNNSGYQDLFVSAYDIDFDDVAREYLGKEIEGSYPRLYRNEGDGTFTDVTEEVNLRKVLYTMGSNYGDLENNGYHDFYVGTGDPDYRSLMPNRMFRNNEGHGFQEVTHSGGFGNIQKGHGVSFADFNHNGFQDIYINMGGALEGDTYHNLFFENPGNDNNWITLQLRGTETNRMALGARVSVTAEGSDGEKTFYRHVKSGGSFGGSPFRQEIGLGEAEHITKLEVFWPVSGRHDVYEDIQPNQLLQITEGAEVVEPMEASSFHYALSQESEHDHHFH